MNEKEMKALTGAVVEAVEPVIDEKMTSLKEEINETTKSFATKQDVVDAVASASVVTENEEEVKMAKAVKAMATFAKTLKKTKNVSMAIKAAGDVADLQNELVDADGGFLVPEEFMAGIIDRLGNAGVIRKRANIIPMSREVYNMKEIASLPAVGWVDEGVKIGKSKVEFKKAQLIARKAAALLPSSLELIEDSTPDNDIWSILTNAVVKAILKFEDTTALNLILADTDVNLVTLTGDTSTVNYDAVVDLIHSIDDEYVTSEDSLEFYGSRSVLGLLRKIKDENGTPIYSTDSKDHFISWYKYNIVSSMPKAWSVGVSAKFLIFGDMKGVFFGDRKTLTLDIGEADGDFERYSKTMRAVERIDINLAYPEVFSVLKTHA